MNEFPFELFDTALSVAILLYAWFQDRRDSKETIQYERSRKEYLSTKLMEVMEQKKD